MNSIYTKIFLLNICLGNFLIFKLLMEITKTNQILLLSLKKSTA